MQADFHYYATYAAAYLAGFTHEESMDICYSAQFVDLCSRTYLTGIKAPAAAATTMLQLEMIDLVADIAMFQGITRIWSSFHFLPRDLYAQKPERTKRYMNKYRLICGPNGDLAKETVKLAMGKPLQSIGIAMHVIADTWAHQYFAGAPSLAINNTTDDFYEILSEDGCETQRKLKFRHNPSVADDTENGIYTNSLYQRDENSVMNIGHGRAGHLPDYSFIKYRYLPAWDDYKVKVKDNPSDYYHAFAQMVYAMKCLRGGAGEFETEVYDTETVAPYEERIMKIIRKRQLLASDDWKQFALELSGREIDDFDVNRYRDEYMSAEHKEETFIGRFIEGAMAQKGMVSSSIYRSDNPLAGKFTDD